MGAANYRLSSYEVANKLHPDMVICAGEAPYLLLQSFPFYKTVNLQIGCALRFTISDSTSVPPLERTTFNKILIPLDGTSDSETLAKFCVELSILEPKSFELRVKEHPNYPISSALKKVIPMSADALSAELSWCDAVLYMGTTVSLEALAVGKPVIHFNSPRVNFNFDPIFQFSDFKYEIDSAEQFLAKLEQLRSLDKNSVTEKSKQAQAFAKKYFSPCTTESLKGFLVFKS